MTTPPPPCPDCGGEPVLNHDDATQRPYWSCACGNRVGCHRGMTEPLGTLADEETRGLRRIVHRFFDPMWEFAPREVPRGRARRMAYAWLADQLGLDLDACHVGMFDAATCRRALDVLAPEDVTFATMMAWDREREPDPDPLNDVPDAMDMP